MTVSDPPAVPIEPTAPASRLPALDAMRLIAAGVIVWIHTVESDTLARSTLIGRFAVPFFTIASLWLLGQSLRRRSAQPWGRYTVSRARLLYVPFLIWNAIYLAARFAKHGLLHTGMPIELNAATLLLGVAEQLWFLPALLVACVASFPVIKLAVTRSAAARTAMCAAALVAAIALSQLPLPRSTGDPAIDNAAQGVYFMLPSVFVGLAVAMALARPLAGKLGAGVFAPLWILAVAANVLVGRSALIETAAGAFAFLVSASRIDGVAIRRIARGGQYAMGIYLAHVLFVEGLQAVAHRGGFGVSAGLDIGVTVASFAGAWCVSIVLQRTPLVPR